VSDIKTAIAIAVAVLCVGSGYYLVSTGRIHEAVGGDWIMAISATITALFTLFVGLYTLLD
jgi:hypothetical protein